MKRNRQTTSVLKFWVLSYLLVLCIPLTVSAAVFGNAFFIMEEEVSSAHLNALRQVQYFIDSKLSTVADTAVRLTTNEQIQILQGVRWKFTPSEHYLMQGIQKDLKALCDANSFIRGIYVYHQASGTILSDRDIYRTQDFDFANAENFQLLPEEFQRMLHRKYGGAFLFYDAWDEQGKPHTLVLYAISLPLLQTGVVKVNLFVAVDWQELSALLEERNWAEGNYISFLTDGGYQVVAPHAEGYRETLPALLKERDGRGEVDSWETDIGGEPCRLSSVRSEVVGGRYFSVLPRVHYRAKIDRLLHIMVLCVVLCVLGGGALAYVFVRRNYRPVRQLVELVDGSQPDRKARLARQIFRHPNEYSLIQENIKKLMDSDRHRREELDWSLQRLRESTLARLMKGGSSAQSWVEELTKLGLHFSSDRFLVAVVCVESFENLFFDGSASDDEETYSLVIFIIRNVAEELLSAHFQVEIAEVEGDVGILLNSSFEMEEQAKDCALHSLRQAQKFIAETFGVRFRFAIGSQEEGTERICRSYGEALQVLEYGELMGDSRAVLREEIAAGKPAHSAGLQSKLLNCMLAGDFPAAREQVRLLVEGYSRGDCPPQLMKSRVLGMVGIFLDGLEELRLKNPELFADIPDCGEELCGIQQLNQLEERICDVLNRLRAAEERRGEDCQSDMGKEMLAYVEAHLCDPELTITALSDRFGLSVSYVSKLFKSLNHIGFLNYVHNRRMELAQELLAGTDENLNAIAEKLGYNNDIALIRMFKKHTGITPGKYRELCRSKPAGEGQDRL